MNLYAYILREDMLRSYNFTLLCISIDKFALLLCKFYNNGECCKYICHITLRIL